MALDRPLSRDVAGGVSVQSAYLDLGNSFGAKAVIAERHPLERSGRAAAVPILGPEIIRLAAMIFNRGTTTLHLVVGAVEVVVTPNGTGSPPDDSTDLAVNGWWGSAPAGVAIVTAFGL